MTHTHTIISADGTTLALYERTVIEKSGASVLLIHGMGDHANALPYRLLGDYLLNGNMNFFSFDLRGHGRSGGKRMYVNSWMDYMDDMVAVCKHIRSVCKCPLFICGLSLGGLIAVSCAQQHPGEFKGIILASPALDNSGSPTLVKLLLPVISMFFPGKLIDLKLDLSGISRDATAVAEYTSDPFWQNKATPRLALATLQAIKASKQYAATMQTPLLLLQGADDRIVPPGGAQAFYNNIEMKEKEKHIYPGALHNLFIETNREEVFADIINWINKELQH
ncbi:MAG: alpha/beta hydrolase [Chitinophagaceae bacterium]|nr:alpha/beta hydrolase [Chitinophagaceae bacterium]